MNEAELTAYLRAHIPLSAAMDVTVRKADPTAVMLEAPLAPNINHRETVFGGSASAVAILAAWTLLFVRLRDEGLDARVVIQENSMRYERPIAGTFTAVAVAPEAEVWARFVKTLQRRGRARISVQSELRFEGERAGWLEGSFVALGGKTGDQPNG
ncbi:MAG: YiiD C-terminal domain-containing protein [Zoogloea oleivorans]|jgi:thioesterase domain-containing protein|uniref:YiiD C-terminal domain-containing protein n=1 Tax=Zoogloea oleivorans TaxID=1552750 RepID=UPI002A3587B1|nr:YiiD C-terminal domain-containing protein [Zoogloea oleivorans]MDY0036596.1 YiiD C-terminal domain-containing protein [Zoogloea oleivorans]